MSNHIISMAYKRDLRTAMRKSVMVLLADKASDDGSGIYASKQTMADELCCSKQTVIDTIKGFISEGLLAEDGQRRNANGFTVEYSINVAALEAVPLVNCHANRQSNRLTGQPAGPVKEIDGTGQPAGPKPSLNHPSEDKSSSGKRATAKPNEFPRPDWADPDVWSDFMTNRKRKRLPSTPTAYRGLLRDIDGQADANWPPGRLLEHAAAKGWGSIHNPDKQDIRHANTRQSSANRNRGRDGFLNACHEAAERQAGGSFAGDG